MNVRELTWKTLVSTITNEVLFALTEAILTLAVWHFECTLPLRHTSISEKGGWKTGALVGLDGVGLTDTCPGVPVTV